MAARLMSPSSGSSSFSLHAKRLGGFVFRDVNILVSQKRRLNRLALTCWCSAFGILIVFL